jgi:hypothetical protein
MVPITAALDNTVKPFQAELMVFVATGEPGTETFALHFGHATAKPALSSPTCKPMPHCGQVKRIIGDTPKVPSAGYPVDYRVSGRQSTAYPRYSLFRYARLATVFA